MIRPALLRTSLRSVAAPRASSSLAAMRSASTKVPTSTSEPPPPQSGYKLAPGEEVDPQLNGYPQLPHISLQRRPALGWWDVQNRRNFGDVMHEEEDVLGMWGPDPQPVSALKAVGQLCIAFACLGTLAYAISKFRPEPHFVRREFPYNGLETELGGHTRANPESLEDEDEE